MSVIDYNSCVEFKVKEERCGKRPVLRTVMIASLNHKPSQKELPQLPFVTLPLQAGKVSCVMVLQYQVLYFT